jgi:hypothetical protein
MRALDPVVTALELKLLGNVSAARHAVRVPGKPYPAEVPDALLEEAAAEIKRLRVENIRATAALMTIVMFPEQARKIAKKAIGRDDAADEGGRTAPIPGGWI